MGTTINKYEEIKEKLRSEGNLAPLSKEFYEKMNEAAEKTKQEFIKKDSNSWVISARYILL